MPPRERTISKITDTFNRVFFIDTQWGKDDEEFVISLMDGENLWSQTVTKHTLENFTAIKNDIISMDALISETKAAFQGNDAKRFEFLVETTAANGGVQFTWKMIPGEGFKMMLGTIQLLRSETSSLFATVDFYLQRATALQSRKKQLDQNSQLLSRQRDDFVDTEGEFAAADSTDESIKYELMVDALNVEKEKLRKLKFGDDATAAAAAAAAVAPSTTAVTGSYGSSSSPGSQPSHTTTTSSGAGAAVSTTLRAPVVSSIPSLSSAPADNDADAFDLHLSASESGNESSGHSSIYMQETDDEDDLQKTPVKAPPSPQARGVDNTPAGSVRQADAPKTPETAKRARRGRRLDDDDELLFD